jgi:hypothetical protein
MKLKSLVMMGLLALASSCTNQGNVFTISNVYPLGPGCDVEALRESNYSPNGSLDVAAGNPQFFIAVEISGAQLVQQQSVMLGNTTLEAANRNRPVVTQQVLTYTLSKRLGAAPKPFETAYRGNFSDNGTFLTPVQLISPELGQSLFDGLTPSANITDDFVDLTVDIEFRGEYAATRNPFTTGVFSYPIRAYRSQPAVSCPNGYVRNKVIDPATGDIERCSYVGQSEFAPFPASQPSSCCPAPAAGTPPPPGC